MPRTSLPRSLNVLSWILQAVAAVILAQTLFFKLTGAPESRFIFQTLGVEPWGRYLTAAAELTAVILLLLPARAALGGLLAAGIMLGALVSHLTRLGIVIQDDGGTLFGLALATLTSSLIVVWLRRHDLPGLRRIGGTPARGPGITPPPA